MIELWMERRLWKIRSPGRVKSQRAAGASGGGVGRPRPRTSPARHPPLRQPAVSHLPTSPPAGQPAQWPTDETGSAGRKGGRKQNRKVRGAAAVPESGPRKEKPEATRRNLSRPEATRQNPRRPETARSDPKRPGRYAEAAQGTQSKDAARPRRRARKARGRRGAGPSPSRRGREGNGYVPPAIPPMPGRAPCRPRPRRASRGSPALRATPRRHRTVLRAAGRHSARRPSVLPGG